MAAGGPERQRKAISRERSAARAANRLPRLAQAASRISPANSIRPATKARTGRPSRLPRSPGRDRDKVNPSSSGYVLLRNVAMNADRRRLFCRDARLQPSHQPRLRPARRLRPFQPSICSWSTIGTQRAGDKNSSVPRNSGRGNAKNGEGVLVQLNRMSDNRRIAREVAAPIRIAEHDVRIAVGTMLIGGCERSGPDTASHLRCRSSFRWPHRAILGWFAARVEPCLRQS